MFGLLTVNKSLKNPCNTRQQNHRGLTIKQEEPTGVRFAITEFHLERKVLKHNMQYIVSVGKTKCQIEFEDFLSNSWSQNLVVS